MKHKLLLIILSIQLSAAANSQTLQGKIISEDNNKIPFATVASLNHLKSISANDEGAFSIVVDKLPDTLVFSAVGYETYTVIVTDKTLKDPDFLVVLLKQRTLLNEVVVTGYSDKRKKDITGSVTTRDYVVLEDRVAGLSYSSRPGTSVKIRGISTFDKEGINPHTEHIASDSTSIVSQNGYKTRLLTAGELNDFNKWKMWEDFSVNDFKILSEQWNLCATRRYCVQVQNEQFAAMVGRQVYLVNSKTKDTVWKAVTDVTGKAELWAGINSNQTEAADYLIGCKDGSAVISQPSEFANGINKIMIHASCNAGNTVDIAFVVDATGSMGDEIEYLKLELEDILKRTFARYDGIDVNAASVFYRDKGDAYLTRYSDFNSDLLKTLNFIKLQQADGGGDMPEAVNSALHTALDSLKWSGEARAKLLFIILDAPPHDEVKKEMYEIIKAAAAKGVRIIPIVCSGADKNTEFIMRTIALATNGSYIFLTDDSGIGNSHIKPTTDKYTVELLNTLLQRIIRQMVYVNNCNNSAQAEPVVKMPENLLQIKVTPNPTSGNIRFSSNKNLKELYVTDYTGKILMKLNPKQSNLQFNLGDYPNGTYLIKYVTQDKRWGAEKLVLIR